MTVAQEHIISAVGWSKFDEVTEDDVVLNNNDRLEFSHKVAKLFSSKLGKDILIVMVQQYLLSDVAHAHDTMVGIGIRQGRSDVVKQILAHIEISKNS